MEGIYYCNAMRFLRKTCNNNGEYADMDKNMTLEKRIAAELYCYQGKMSVFVDDLQGHTVEVGADEEFETASTIKAFILAALYLQAQRGKADLAEEIAYEQSQFVDGSGMLRALGVGAKLKVKDTATMMIICSDNIATNMIIDYLGLDTINACIRELGFAHTVLHNPLHFDRYRRFGTTTPRDYAALFARIAKGAGQPGSQRRDACHPAPAALQHHADPRLPAVLPRLRGDRSAGADLGSQQERQHERLPQRRRHRPHPLRRVCHRADEQGFSRYHRIQ